MQGLMGKQAWREIMILGRLVEVVLVSQALLPEWF